MITKIVVVMLLFSGFLSANIICKINTVKIFGVEKNIEDKKKLLGFHYTNNGKKLIDNDNEVFYHKRKKDSNGWKFYEGKNMWIKVKGDKQTVVGYNKKDFEMLGECMNIED